MKITTLFFVSLVLSGCVAVSYDTEWPNVTSEETAALVTNMDKVSHGMSFEEVQKVMGETQQIGYERCADCPEGRKNIVINNPYRVESLTKRGRPYKVAFYYTDIRKADGMVAEDELTPLIFEDDVLIGKGQNFLFELKKN